MPSMKNSLFGHCNVSVMMLTIIMVCVEKIGYSKRVSDNIIWHAASIYLVYFRPTLDSVMNDETSRQKSLKSPRGNSVRGLDTWEA